MHLNHKVVKTCITDFVAIIVALSLLTTTAYALPSGSTDLILYGFAIRSSQTSFGSSRTITYNPTDTQASSNGRCSTNEVIVGHSVTDGSYSNYRFSKDVHFNLTRSDYDNYSQRLMTSGGTRTVTCQTIQMGF